MGRLSTTCNGTYGSKYNLYLDYSCDSPDVANNRTYVYLSMWAQASSSSYGAYNNNAGSNSYNVTINGSNVASGTKAMDFRNTAVVSLGSYSGYVGHNSDGTLTITIGGSFSISGTSSLSGGSISGSWTLPTIPRTSTPTLSKGSADMNTAITIYTNRASSGFTHNIYWYFGNQSGTISTGVADSVSWTLPLSMANEIPNAVSGVGTITCDTYSSGTYIGSKSISFTANVPSSIVPSFSSITGAEANTSVNTIVGKYVQNLSKITFTINGVTIAYNSAISSYKINFDGVDYNGSSVTTNTITKSGTIRATATITDARGRSATKTLDVTLLPYSTPTITNFTVTRANSNGTDNAMGTYAKIVTVGNVSSLESKNTLTYTLYSRARGATSWTTIKSATTISGVSLNLTNTLGTYTATSSYDFRLDIADKFNTAIAILPLSSGEVTMSWSKNGVGIGKVHQQGSLDVAGDAYIGGNTINTGYQKTQFDSNSVATFNNFTSFFPNSSVNTGTICITIPKENLMFDAEINVYCYYELIKLHVKGYTYTASSGWHTPMVTKVSSGDIGNIVNIRFGTDASGRRVILIGGISTAWGGYLHVTIPRISIGYGVTNISPWTISLITSESGITNVVSPTINIGMSVDMVDGYHASDLVARNGFTTSVYSFYNNITLASNPNGMAVGLYNNGNWNAPFVTNPVKNTTYYIHNGIKYLAMNISLSTECLVEVDVTANLTSSGVNSFYSKVAIFNGFIGSETTQVFSGDEVVFTPSASYWTQVNTKALCILPAGNYSVWTTYRPDSTFTGTVGTAISHMKVVLYRR